MLIDEYENLVVEQKAIASRFLKRYVIVDFLLPKNILNPENLPLLLINDGQNLEEMELAGMLSKMITSNAIQPVFVCGIHANKDRIDEYGTAHTVDFQGRGKKAAAYQQFLVQELLPFIQKTYCINQFASQIIAGFSMGGLSALDTTLNHPDVFNAAGVFSGSLWWRSRDIDELYNDDVHRIMHQKIRDSSFEPGLKFYFMTGSQDETADRNNNGIIDSIDDTLAAIRELEALGYNAEEDIRYVNYEDGAHNIASWARAFPEFLKWQLSCQTTVQNI